MAVRTGTLGLTAAVLMAAAAVGVRHLAAAHTGRRNDAAARHERWVHQADIRFYEGRVAHDPRGAQDRATLARLYLQHARETGSFDDNVRAESLARRSLSLRTAHNADAWGILASALLAQHRFPEALAAAESLATLEDWVAANRALLGEIAFESGRYELARTVLDSLRHDAHRLDVAPRLARWAELNGQVGRARVLLQRALAEAKSLGHLPRETVAWFALRLGDLELREGNHELADRYYREGLAIAPGDYRLAAAMARLSLERGQPADAVRWGDEVLRTVLEPGTLGVLSDAWAALGEPDKAAEYAHVMEVAVAGQPGPIHRQWALFLLDHGLSVDLVAQRARDELRTRTDIYGYDVLAWALFKQGRLTEARTAMDSALRLGTRDPLLDRHRAAIDRVLTRTRSAAR